MSVSKAPTSRLLPPATTTRARATADDQDRPLPSAEEPQHGQEQAAMDRLDPTAGHVLPQAVQAGMHTKGKTLPFLKGNGRRQAWWSRSSGEPTALAIGHPPRHGQGQDADEHQTVPRLRWRKRRIGDMRHSGHLAGCGILFSKVQCTTFCGLAHFHYGQGPALLKFCGLCWMWYDPFYWLSAPQGWRHGEPRI
jgi:hypothetical protein